MKTTKEPMADAVTHGEIIEAALDTGDIIQMAFVPLFEDTDGVWVIRDVRAEYSHITDAETVENVCELNTDIRMLTKEESVFEI